MARRLALLAALALGGCAASTGGNCDPQNDPGCTVDASTRDLPTFPDAPATVDAITVDSPNLAFGEACTDKSQCASRVCIFSGVSGYCSELCSSGSCPSGYGCYGVLGVIEPGQVSNVCVKDSNLLCTACMMSEECSATSRDLCLPSPTGGSFCARDCTTIECPMGFVCSDVTVGQNTFKQCLPASGACDCNVMNAGAKKSCDIETPFGKCTGSRTCLGGAGWGDCTPPSPTDEPDGNFADDNCDGIDGDIAGGIFVANGGTNSATCGLVYGSPCQTITYAEGRAVDAGRTWVYAQAGIYNETVALRDGIHLAGGYDGNWQRAARTTAGHETRIVGQSFDGEAIALVARNLGTQTRVLDVVIYAAAGSGSRGDVWGARASYGVHALNANLKLERVTINEANGANGARGGDGTDAPSTGATSGMTGCPYTARCANDHDSDAVEEARCCSHERKPGGGAGTNGCGGYAGGNTSAGNGGSGGAMDGDSGTSCGFPTFCAADASGGATGQFAAWWSNTPGDIFGVGGSGTPGTGGMSLPGGRGADGTHFNGSGGPGGTPGGRLVDGKYWYAWQGGAGYLGYHGTGGGGGGGSGASDAGTDSTGAGGGGGGAGGCAAQAGGGGGQGGGGSFGIFAVASTAIAKSCVINRADGGTGGPGGTGGQGQAGGVGSPGGLPSGDSSQGGIGGNGGHGGHAGGGGGGSGGVSYGVFYNNSNMDVDGSNTISNSGNGGGGGGGGPSAPNAPNQDGFPGNTGPMGGSGKLFNCTNPSGC